MPVINGVGQSDYTAIKEEHYKRILAWHFAVANRVIANGGWNDDYLLIDATAGRGYMDDGTKGSPLVAIEQLDKVLNRRLVLIEERADNVTVLRSVVGKRKWITVLHCRYQDEIRRISETPDDRQIGMIYVDPNGAVDFDALRIFAEARPRMEVLIAFTAAGHKRSGNETKIEDGLRLIGKRGWTIRRPYDAHQWTFIFGSNFLDGFKKDYRAIEMVTLDSPEGRVWLERISTTRKERVEQIQPPLIELTPNI